MNEPTSQATFSLVGLASVLKENALVVQPNQRDYAWEESYVTKLFKDIAKSINDGEKTYFLGTVVTIPRSDGTLEVVDGQQRLATTALLLAAIRDYLGSSEPMLVESINNEFLTGINRGKRERLPKLRLNVDDNDLFRWLIARNANDAEPPATKESHHLLKGAYDLAAQHVKNIVSTLDPKDHADELNRWVSFLELNAAVVLVRVPSGANAYKMFETLNDRGLRTSQADLIKNYLFGRSGNRFAEVQARWSFMRGQLETLDEDEITVTFLRQALIATRGFVRSEGVYDSVVEAVKSEQGAVTFSSALETASNAYVAIFNPEHDKWNGYPDAARRSIEVLNLFDIKPLRPLLLSITMKMDSADAGAALQFMVSLSARLLITASTRTGSVEESLAGVAHKVFEGELTTLARIKQRLEHIIPNDEVFRLDFESARVSKQQLARYYLRSLELAAKNEPEPWFRPTDDRAIINLEHVLPKKPENNWPQFKPEEAAIYVNRLGNQVLLRASDNSVLKSDPFTTKKAVFSASPYILTSQVATLPDWTPEAIVDRQKGLARLALTAWPI